LNWGLALWVAKKMKNKSVASTRVAEVIYTKIGMLFIQIKKAITAIGVYQATSLKIGNRKKLEIFSLLCKLLAKPSCKHPPTMVSADYRSGTPSLPITPFPGRNDSEWSWLIDVCLDAGWGHQGGRGTTAAAMVKKCIWSSFC
jgi:hypothetical protein